MGIEDTESIESLRAERDLYREGWLLRGRLINGTGEFAGDGAWVPPDFHVAAVTSAREAAITEVVEWLERGEPCYSGWDRTLAAAVREKFVDSQNAQPQRIVMTFVLRETVASETYGYPLWFWRMTGIGPATTADPAKRATFATRDEAQHCPAMWHMLSSYEVEEVASDPDQIDEDVQDWMARGAPSWDVPSSLNDEESA
jgi:hypothetical protein